jgi:hypothetical protein
MRGQGSDRDLLTGTIRMVRDSKGRFKKGVSGNPDGRPKSEVNITALIDQCVTESDWIEMLNAGKAKAKRGDIKWVEWFTDRRFGKPVQPVAENKATLINFIEVALDSDDNARSTND